MVCSLYLDVVLVLGRQESLEQAPLGHEAAFERLRPDDVNELVGCGLLLAASECCELPCFLSTASRGPLVLAGGIERRGALDDSPLGVSFYVGHRRPPPTIARAEKQRPGVIPGPVRQFSQL